jgi:hypothetical protein
MKRGYILLADTAKCFLLVCSVTRAQNFLTFIWSCYVGWSAFNNAVTSAGLPAICMGFGGIVES